MTADEIRETWKINSNGSTETLAQLRLEVGCELAAQVAELNEARKPRWVNLSPSDEPVLIDATQVIGLSAGKAHNNGNEYISVVYILMRGVEKLYTIWHLDHDEVRARLGIDENWIQPAAPYYDPSTLSISRAEWSAAQKVVELARSTLNMLPDTKRIEVTEAIGDYDNYSMPF